MDCIHTTKCVASSWSVAVAAAKGIEAAPIATTKCITAITLATWMLVLAPVFLELVWAGVDANMGAYLRTCTCRADSTGRRSCRRLRNPEKKKMPRARS